MRKIFLCFCLLLVILKVHAQNLQLPSSIYSGKQGKFHVQGSAVDQARGFVYFSFTDRLIKTDLSGKLISSVTGIVGHLGDIDITEDGKIYASLEYKNDAIGKGIQKGLNAAESHEDGFYIAIFDGNQMTAPDIPAESGNVMHTVYIKEAVNDYNARFITNGVEKIHRFGCSGIDGIALAPTPGEKSNKKYLFLAYGIYGDTARNDNDFQVLLKYDLDNLNRYASILTQNNLHHAGPLQPQAKYFVYTGNTRYGIQNLAYDPDTGNLFAAVYRGQKTTFPNHDLFVIDGKSKPRNESVVINGDKMNIQTLSLISPGAKKQSKPGGWNFPWGSTGLYPIGNGEWYISHNEKNGNAQETTLYKYRWLGTSSQAFERMPGPQ